MNMTIKTVSLIYIRKLKQLAAKALTFSAGVGQSLREAYIALLAAKSNGKACLYNFSEMT